MTKNVIVRVWSRVPLFLKILLYGSAIVPVIAGTTWTLMEVKDYRCQSARVAEAQAWTALAEHFDQWETTHPNRQLSVSAEGSLHLSVAGDRAPNSWETRAAYCRRAARHLEQGLGIPFNDPLPDPDDEVGQRLWRGVELNQRGTLSRCYRVGKRGPLHDFH